MLTIWLVKMPRPTTRQPGTRDRLLRAATREFAAHGFDGAKVDRIAARARVNKAMLYYHFHDKAALYREILRDVFAAVADATLRVREAGGAPECQVRQFVAAIAREGVSRPDFPAIWLRELADGGRHLDSSVVAEMQRVLAVLAGILADGRARGVFGPASPFIAHLGIVAPLLIFSATGPIRSRFVTHGPAGAAVSLEDLSAHVQTTTLAALARGAEARRPGRDARRTRR